MRRLYFLLIVLLLCALTPAAAQNQQGYPLPDTLQVITPENAGHLGQWASIGGELPGDLAWSPDGKTLAVGTTGGVRAFDSTNWDTPPMQFPGWKDVRFDAAGNLISDGSVIDPNSGATLIEDAAHKTPSGKFKIEYRDFGGHAGVLLTDMVSGMPVILDTGLKNGTIKGLAFSPDEQVAAMDIMVPPERGDQPPNFELAVQLWNVTTGTLVKTLDTTGFDPTDSIDTFGFHNGGKLLVLSTYYNGIDGNSASIQIWDVRGGKALNPEANQAMLPLVFSPDDSFMAFSVGEGMALWSDHKIGVLKEENGFMYPIFSPNGKMLAGYGAGGIKVWTVDNALKLGEPEKTFAITDPIINGVVFSPDNKLLADSEYGNRVRVWNLETDAVEVVLENVGGARQFSPNSQWILAQRTDNSKFALWDAHTGERLMDFDENFAINADWTFAAQGSVQIIALPSGQPIRSLQVLDGYLGAVGRFDADANRILFARQAFDTRSGQMIFETNYYPSTPLVRDAFSTDWTRMLVADNLKFSDQAAQPSALVLQPQLGQAGSPSYFWGDGISASTTAFLTRDGKAIGYITKRVSYSEPIMSRLEFREVETGNHIAERLLPGDVQAVTISHDGKWVVFGTTARGEGRLIFLDLTEDLSKATPVVRTIYPPVYGDGISLTNLTFSADDSRIAVGGYMFVCGDGCINDYFVKSWGVEPLLAGKDSGEQSSLGIANVETPIHSHDGKLLLVTPASGAVELWDTVANKKVIELSGDDGIAAFSPDGKLLAVHQTDRTVFYDTAELQRGIIRVLVTCPDRDHPVNQVAFSADGKVMYVVSDNRVRLYAVGS